MLGKLLIVIAVFSAISYSSTEDIIYKAADRVGVDGRVLLSICTVESGLNSSIINSDDGNGDSLGLCQIKLATAKLFAFKGHSKDLLKPYVNAYYAARYLKLLYIKYNNYDHAIAAYNMGHLKLNNKGLIWNRSYVKRVRRILVALQSSQD